MILWCSLEGSEKYSIFRNSVVSRTHTNTHTRLKAAGRVGETRSEKKERLEFQVNKF